MKTRSKRRHPCTTCGRATQALTGICRACTAVARETEDALTGGEWRPDRRGILRWTPTPTAA